MGNLVAGRVSEVHRISAFAHIIAIPRRYLDRHLACEHSLTGQTRMKSQARRHVERIQFIIVRGTQVAVAIFYKDVLCAESLKPLRLRQTGTLPCSAQPNARSCFGPLRSSSA